MDKSYVSIGELEQLYQFRDAAVVKDFLRNNPDVLLVLAEAPDVIHQAEYFPNAQLFLEADEEFQKLIIFVHDNQDVPSAFATLTNLDRNWWLAAKRQAARKLSILLELG